MIQKQSKEPTNDEISQRAYALFLGRGCQHGSDVQDWVNAANELSGKPTGAPAVTKSAHEAASHQADLRSAWPE
jgi:hypothetical protein